MRNMSFSLTTKQIQEKTKTVTRRLDWEFLEPGDLVRPVVKAMGLKKGEKVQPIRGPLLVVSVRREPLHRMFSEHDNATALEGFPFMMVKDFIRMFCRHMNVRSNRIVTRIEFEYTD